MAKNGTKDLTCGKPFGLIVSFTIPIFMGILFQQFYNLMDTMIVGQILGKEALSAVGATGSVMFMILGFCNGTASGFAIPIAQRFGAKDEKGVQKCTINSIWLSGIVSVVMTLIVSFLCRDILELMNTPENIINRSYAYLIVIFLGIPITFFYNLFSGIIRSLGDSKTPVVFLVLASVINIVLDVVLIKYVGMGVEGAAYATIISQFIAMLGCGIYMIKKFPILHMEKEERKPDSHCMKQLIYMGMPMGLQYSITAIGSVILQTAVNGLGSDAVAALTAGSKLGMFICALYEALGSTMATFGGQNVGAKKMDRVTKGLNYGIIIGAVYSVLACVFLNIFGDKLVLLFINAKETQIIHDAARFLKIESIFYIGLTLVNTIRFMIQGMGFSSFAVIAGIMEMVARALAGFILVPYFGFTAVCLASPLAWIFADAFLIPAFFHVRKKLMFRFAIE